MIKKQINAHVVNVHIDSFGTAVTFIIGAIVKLQNMIATYVSLFYAICIFFFRQEVLANLDCCTHDRP